MTQPAPTPINEAARLRRLASLCLDGHTQDPVFEDLIDLVQAYFKAPIALISILEGQHQWFKASRGTCVKQTPREMSFCGYAILDDNAFVVPDATLDERFQDNPLVTGSPYIRFYAGMPLKTEDGLGLGTLCVIDTQPRPPLSPTDVGVLKRFASLVMHRITGLRTSTFYDQHTGLLNPLRLEHDIAARRHQPLQSLVAIDMVAPQMLNDIVKALGYEFSLHLMRAMHAELIKLLPAQTPIYRMSHTRIGFFMEGGPSAASNALFNSIAQRFKRPLMCEGIPIQTQIGIGAIELDYQQPGMPNWVRKVIGASDDARVNGKGWAWYEAGLGRAQQRTFLLLSALAEALQSSDQLRLAYQPRFDTQSGQMLSAEALLRWEHPFLGAVSPGEFVPLAERTSMIRPLSLWVIRQAVAQAVKWHRAGNSLKVSVNVSAVDLDGPHFTDTLLGLLAESGLPPRLLELEFTESALCRSPEQVREQLERLRLIGIDVAIDDFGTGYSNWTYLRQLPATAIKLDRSLICNITQDETDRRLVETLIELGSQLGYRIVAEGVETAATLDLLEQVGCHEVQGYHLARPMELQAFERWRAQRPGRATSATAL
ncbi:MULTISPECIES: EAL domain-containing protein [Pseudomonas]|uniref:EAL domain-containing protein n=1 Tax=Pseudomonas quercus TaxID=2722792 RepID=A0ABX0YME5_9PSED|nr:MULTISPECIES: EAL domain-containing protein [Pseudomonas]MBF7144714.1 EAL domain-containing protein [Pseudomonas sp. LY10J]NJP03251.1 EAL domain-containing protein [Pseudomonas quercus]